MARNTWGGKTLEWESDSPPIQHNFEGQPVCLHGPYDYRENPAPVGVKELVH